MKRRLKRLVLIIVLVTWIPLVVCFVLARPHLLGMYQAYKQLKEWSAEVAATEEAIPVSINTDGSTMKKRRMPWEINIAEELERATAALWLTYYEPGEDDMIQMDLVQSVETRSVWYVRRGGKTTTVILHGIKFGTTFDPTLPPPERIVALRTPSDSRVP